MPEAEPAPEPEPEPELGLELASTGAGWVDEGGGWLVFGILGRGVVGLDVGVVGCVGVVGIVW